MSNNPTILVVEDEVLILDMIETALQDGGFRVVSAASSAQAIARLDSQTEPFRGLVTDVNMGRGKTGWDVARHARDLNPAIMVVYVSGHGADEWASHGLPKSVMITKPFAVAQLLTAVSSLLNNSPERG